MSTVMPGLLFPHFESEQFRYSKDTQTLVLNEYNDLYPKSLFVKSSVTGKVIRFNIIDDSHPKFDMDQWDGEQQVYAPDIPVSGAERLTVVLSRG
jgi:hypothetical protein